MTDASQTAQFYAALREAILTLQLSPGARLTERGLEAAYAASRTPVRAALSRLDVEGLVQRDGRGWRVAPIDTNQIGELAELREAIETAAARLAVERATAHDLDALADALHSAGDHPTAEEGVREGSDFHVLLTALSGNALMVDSVRGAMTRLARTRWFEVRTPEARKTARDEHRAILAAVAARDADAASRLLAAHIRGTHERLLASLASDEPRLRGHGMVIASAGAVHPDR